MDGNAIRSATKVVAAGIIAVGFANVANGQPAAAQSENPLFGVWEVAEIVAPDGSSNSDPQPTVYTFMSQHYSHVSVTSATPRPFHAGANMTDAQKLEMWEPFSATAGTYDLGEGEFTIRPIVAKNPGFMTEGSFTTFEFTIEDGDLWIRASGSPGGPIPQAFANRVRLVRVE